MKVKKAVGPVVLRCAFCEKQADRVEELEGHLRTHEFVWGPAAVREQVEKLKGGE
jgi:hypothetical protein